MSICANSSDEFTSLSEQNAVMAKPSFSDYQSGYTSIGKTSMDYDQVKVDHVSCQLYGITPRNLALKPLLSGGECEQKYKLLLANTLPFMCIKDLSHIEKLNNIYDNPSSINSSSNFILPQSGDEESVDRLTPITEFPEDELLTDSCNAPIPVKEISSMLEGLSKIGNFKITDDLVSEIEGVVALAITLRGCTNYVSMSSALFLYIRKFFDKSVTGQVMTYVRQMFEFETQSGVEDTVGTSSWLQIMRNSCDNWALVKSNKLFDKFSKLLGLVVTIGMCKASQLTFSIKDFKLFEPDMKIIHGSAVDMIDAALQTVVFFVESFTLCFKEKSLRPLLMGNRAAVELDEEFANITLWWELVKNGNLMKVKSISDAEFDKRLELLTTRLRDLLGTKTSFEKKMLQDKFTKLLKIKNDYITMKISSGVRKAPFVIELYGGSSQGKTTCGDQLLDALLTSAGLPTSKEYRASYNAADKYMSSWTSNKLVMTIDDMANDKSSFVDRPPTRAIIDICNNQPYYANMANLESKGKVFVEPSIVVVNTNVKDLDARTYSNCPYSIQRRMHAVITVEAKPEFQYIVDGKPQGIDSSKVAAFYTAHNVDPTFDDIWYLTVEKAVQPATLKTSANYAPVVHEGVELKRVSFRVVLQYLIEQYQAHLVSQDSILERMSKRQKCVKICSHAGCKQISGYCDLHDSLENQLGLDTLNSAMSSMSDRLLSIRRDYFGVAWTADSVSTEALINSARHFSAHWDWIRLVPTPWLYSNYLQNFLMLMNYREIKNTYIRRTCYLWLSLSLFLSLFIGQSLTCFGTLGVFLLLFGLTTQKAMISIIKRDFRQQLVDRNTIAPMMRDVRDSHISRACKTIGVVGAMYTIARIYKFWRRMAAQGSLEPKDMNDIARRDAEGNQWTEVVARSLPFNQDSINTTPSQLYGLVSKNLVYGTIVAGDTTYMANALFLNSNIVLLPDHYFKRDLLDVTFRKENPDSCGGKFAVRLSKSHSILLPDTDLRVCYSSSGGSFRDLTKYLVDDDIPVHDFELFWRGRSGRLTNAQGLAYPCRADNTVCQFKGFRYRKLSIDTFQGLCGAILVSRRRAIITGIHLGGRSDTPDGCAGLLKRSDILNAICDLKALEGVILSGSAEKFEEQVLGVEILNDKPLHPKSPLNFMPNESQVEYYGTCKGMTTFVSNVRPTLISEYVTEIMDEPNIFGPPVQKPQYFGWQTCLSNLAVPALPYDPSLLIMAVRDYKDEMLPIFRSMGWRDSCPLTDKENLCGIPGLKFMDAIKLDTSIGYPLSGKKRAFITELPPTQDRPCNRFFDPMIVDEINRCEDCYRKGQRAYPIAKACKKDEVLSKPKCRIFYGNSISLTWLIRKYYLPIVRVMQMYPLKSECAVGVNSHGPEWNELHDHIMTFGGHRLIGGDYGKYDQKLPSQLIFASLRIMIDFARVCDYSSEDLSIMEAMTGDIVYSVIAFNGDLIGLTEGTHISGNSLTVILNGICGSLNLRCYFYSTRLDTTFSDRQKFRDYVKLITYGDDNIGSVSESISNFTIKGAAEFLEQYGQVYTMPDKESVLQDFLPIEEFEFLKRKSVYHPDLRRHLGALVDKSCIKMLHCYIRDKNSPLTEELACAVNIDTALREWFNHGEEIYEQRRKQLIIIADKANISHLCMELDIPYMERVYMWNRKYTDREAYRMYNEPNGFGS